MTQYLLSVYPPDGPPPPEVELARIDREVAVVHDEMKAAGVWVFSGVLFPPSTATVLRPEGGEVLVTDGPFIEGKEHIGGFTIIEESDLDAALEWGRRLARIIVLLPVEVRPFQDDQGA
jgi:hypothetical protein